MEESPNTGMTYTTHGKKKALGKLVKVGEDEKVESPGLKYKHYSPKAAVRLVEGDDNEFRGKVMKLGLEARERGEKVAILDYGNDPGKAALIERMNSRNAIHTAEAAARHGIGTMDYDIIAI